MDNESQGYTIVISIQKPTGEEHQSDVRIWRLNNNADLERAFSMAIKAVSKVYQTRVK
jgi:hypothetical protein